MKIQKITNQDQENAKNLINSIIDTEFDTESVAYNYNDLDNLSDAYNGEREIFYTAKDDYDELVGTIGIKEDDEKTALLRRIFVSKKIRQSGCGSKLLKKALNFVKEMGYKNISFRGTERMSAAISLMVKNGFVEKEIINTGEHKIFLLEKKV